ncbi:MAG: hypothetical protein RIQ47_1864 [Bacteroidota bacterium]|jgi:tetratricopeptide (TPR) repeat protein
MKNKIIHLRVMTVNLTICAILLTFLAKATDAGKLVADGNSAYQKKDYESAIKNYSAALSSSGRSVELEYNLANAYYKQGSIANAILHYERALRLDPSDEDIAFNLRIASLKTVDKIDVMPEIFYKRWINAIVTLFSEHTWSTLLLISVWGFFAALLSYFIAASTAIKKLSFSAAIVLLILAGCFYSIASAAKSIEYDSQAAIVMSTSAYVKSSPDEKGNDLLILHEGTKVGLLDELGEWKKIRIANGTVGWINVNAIESI